MTGGEEREIMSKMVNKRFLEMVERQMNDGLPTERPTHKKPLKNSNINFPNLPIESFLMNYDGFCGEFFQELITKVNEVYAGTKAEIPLGKSGEVQGHIIKRMALISTIVNDSNLKSHGFYPITPIQDELLLKAGKLQDPSEYWEDLALILYDTNGTNQKEATALKESIGNHRTDLGLSESDLEKRLVVVSAGGEVDLSMSYGVKPIIIPGITQVYTSEILDKTGDSHKFEYGLDNGLPVVSEIGNGNRTLYMPSANKDIGLRVLYRYRGLDLDARDDGLVNSGEVGRVNFARSASP